MPEYIEARRPLQGRQALLWFALLELLCVSGFVAMLEIGQNKVAAAFLLGPFQLLAWSALLSSGQALLVAFTALLPLAGAGMLPHTYERLVYLPGTAVLLCMLVVARHVFGESYSRTQLRLSEWLPLLLLGACSLISGANAVRHGWGCPFLLSMTLTALEVVIIAYFFAAIPRSLKDVRVISHTAVVAAVFVALCIPLLRSSTGVIGPTLGGKIVTTPFGDVHLNTLAYVIGPIGAVALGMAVGTDKLRTRVLLGVAAFACAVMLVLTKSRGAWFGFGVAFLYVMAMRRSPMLLVSAAAVGVVVIMSDFLRGLFISRAHATGSYDPSLLGRFLLWDFAWRIGKANWLLGVGMENFRYVKHFYGYPLPIKYGVHFNSHNIYLEAFVDLGITGVIAFVWMLVSSFMRFFRAARTRESCDLGTGLSAGILAYAAHGFFDCILFQPGVFALLGLLVGLSASVRRLTPDASFPDRRAQAC